MRKLSVVLAILILGSTLGAFAQQNQKEKDEIYFVSWLKPYNDKIQEFEKAVRTHNQKFHSEDGVSVFYNITGEYHGHYEFVQGPYTWTEWENLESMDGHEDDWLKNVMPLVEKTPEPTSWRRMPKFELNPMQKSVSKSLVTVLTIKPGEYPRFMKMLDEWHQANKNADDYTDSYNVYARTMGGTSQVAIVSPLENGWAEFDEENNFRQRFENEHGKSNWDVWIDDADMTLESEDVSARVYLSNLSSGS